MTDLRRRELLLGAGAASLVHLVGCSREPPPPHVPASPPLRGDDRIRSAAPPPGVVLAYFGTFGVDQKLVSQALAAALARGADRADLYFEHRVKIGRAHV